jgi:hypothetical protein
MGKGEITMTEFDDTNFEVATTHLIYQLNNLSQYLKQPAFTIWDVVLNGSDSQMEIFFNGEDGVRDVTQATVRALCAIYLMDATVQPFHIDAAIVWSEIREHDELNDYDRAGATGE